MTPTVAKAHALAREHPDASARVRLYWAREAPPPVPPGDWANGADGPTVSFTTEGFDVTIHFEPDYYPEPRARFTDAWESGAVQHPAWRPNEWNRNRVNRWIVLEAGNVEDHYEGLHKMGYSKSVARALAEEYVRQDIQHAIDPEEWVCSVTASKAGVELGRDTLGGIDGDMDYLRRVAFDHGMVEVAVAEAKATLARLCDSGHSE